MTADRPGPWRVRVVYVESGYANERGIELHEYAAVFDLRASDEESARNAAAAAFREAGLRETVGWVKTIVRTEIVERPEPGELR